MWKFILVGVEFLFLRPVWPVWSTWVRAPLKQAQYFKSYPRRSRQSLSNLPSRCKYFSLFMLLLSHCFLWSRASRNRVQLMAQNLYTFVLFSCMWGSFLPSLLLIFSLALSGSPATSSSSQCYLMSTGSLLYFLAPQNPYEDNTGEGGYLFYDQSMNSLSLLSPSSIWAGPQIPRAASPILFGSLLAHIHWILNHECYHSCQQHLEFLSVWSQVPLILRYCVFSLIFWLLTFFIFSHSQKRSFELFLLSPSVFAFWAPKAFYKCLPPALIYTAILSLQFSNPPPPSVDPFYLQNFLRLTPLIASLRRIFFPLLPKRFAFACVLRDWVPFFNQIFSLPL